MYISYPVAMGLPRAGELNTFHLERIQMSGKVTEGNRDTSHPKGLKGSKKGGGRSSQWRGKEGMNPGKGN